jgi:hypothetical protein
MAHFSTTVEVDGLRAEDAFAYLADFSTTQEWDPGVVRARRNDSGPVTNGSTFEVEASFMGRTVPLTYEIIDLRADELVTLKAENGSVVSLDTLTFASTDSGTDVTYEAELTGKGMLRWANPLLQRLFNKIGKAAEAGLEKHLKALANPTNSSGGNLGSSES